MPIIIMVDVTTASGLELKLLPDVGPFEDDPKLDEWLAGFYGPRSIRLYSHGVIVELYPTSDHGASATLRTPDQVVQEILDLCQRVARATADPGV